MGHVNVIRVGARSAAATQGYVRVGDRVLRCGLGRGGIRATKREGDGATPRGCWPLRAVVYRADRALRPRTGLAVRRIARGDGWCDAPGDRNYNRAVRHPYPASAEHMWRADSLYDLVVVVGHNDRPRRRGLGSAIFIHLARAGYRPSEGCITLSPRDLRRLLAVVGPRTRVCIGA